MQRIICILATLLVCKIVIGVFIGFADYFPPNFQSDFLRGRGTYFFGAYGVAFYVHIVSGPLTLLAGLLLISDAFRRRFPVWHRRIGRIQVLCILLLLNPSGLWMALYAETGTLAGAGFATLALTTTCFAALGWRAAVTSRFDHHRRWMLRTYVLLCSAVVLRVIGGLSEVLLLEETYPLAAWISWLLPLLLLELCLRYRFTSSPPAMVSMARRVS